MNTHLMAIARTVRGKNSDRLYCSWQNRTDEGTGTVTTRARQLPGYELHY